MAIFNQFFDLKKQQNLAIFIILIVFMLLTATLVGLSLFYKDYSKNSDHQAINLAQLEQEYNQQFTDAIHNYATNVDQALNQSAILRLTRDLRLKLLDLRLPAVSERHLAVILFLDEMERDLNGVDDDVAVKISRSRVDDLLQLAFK